MNNCKIKDVQKCEVTKGNHLPAFLLQRRLIKLYEILLKKIIYSSIALITVRFFVLERNI